MIAVVSSVLSTSHVSSTQQHDKCIHHCLKSLPMKLGREAPQALSTNNSCGLRQTSPRDKCIISPTPGSADGTLRVYTRHGVDGGCREQGTQHVGGSAQVYPEPSFSLTRRGATRSLIVTIGPREMLLERSSGVFRARHHAGARCF